MNDNSLKIERKSHTLKDSYWLAERLGISWEKARAMGREKEVPAIRIGKLIRYSEEAIDQWVNDNMIQPRS